MIKLIIFGVLGLLVGMGGGSAASVMKARKAFAAFEAERAKVVADSIAKVGEHGKGDAQAAAGESHTDSTTTDSTVASREDAVAHPPDVKEHAPATAEKAHDTRAVAAKPEPRGKTAAPRPVETVESRGATTRPHLPALPPKPVNAAVGGQSEKLSKIFGAMPAKDAAKVLEQLDDSEVQAILTGLSDKQAAGILQNLPPQRAAAISKLVLRGGRP